MNNRCTVCHHTSRPEIDRDGLFHPAAAGRSLHVALGGIRESLRLVSLPERCRHLPGGRFP